MGLLLGLFSLFSGLVSQAAPVPLSDFRNIGPIVADVVVVLGQQAVHLIDKGRALVLEGWDLLNRVLGQVKAVKVVQDPHVKRRRNVPVIGVTIGGAIGALLLKKMSNGAISFLFYALMLFAGLKMIF